MNQSFSLQKNATYHTLDFSICTIVNDMEEYEVMKKSFIEKGFIDNCEYIIADNCKGNQFDAYQAIAHFLKIAKGEFIIIVHQDVRAIDDRNTLNNCLTELQNKDSNWAICGNAGGRGYHQNILHISYPSHSDKSPGLPVRVKTLDENLLVIKRATNITISPNLAGFHLYGTDICIIANFLGYSCYVIPFMIEHLSKGNITSLKKDEGNFINKYGEKMKIGFLQTTCTQFYLSNSTFKNKLYNTKFVFFIIKQFQRYPYLFSKDKIKSVHTKF